MHLRNVFDFFYDGWGEDNVIAPDYFATWPDANVVRPKLDAEHPLRVAQKRVSVELAHLTTGRRPPNERQGWDAPGLTAMLRPYLVTFAQRALPERIDPRLRQLYQ